MIFYFFIMIRTVVLGFFEWLNRIHLPISFSLKSHDQAIPYLDMVIFKDPEGKLIV